jgi:hypothetical protein
MLMARLAEVESSLPAVAPDLVSVCCAETTDRQATISVIDFRILFIVHLFDCL